LSLSSSWKLLLPFFKEKKKKKNLSNSPLQVKHHPLISYCGNLYLYRDFGKKKKEKKKKKKVIFVPAEL